MGAHSIYLSIIVVLIIIMVCYQPGAVAIAEPRKHSIAIQSSLTSSAYKAQIDKAIETASEEDFGPEKTLKAACYDAVAGGKRIRSIILLEVVKSNNEDINAAESALFIEYIHAASLVIDDLPAFDNDMTRRGSPSIHAKYGQAVAQMTAMTLLAASLQNICRQLDNIRKDISNADRVGTKICSEVSRYLSLASSGQYLDSVTNENITRPQLISLLYKKTATFFEAAVVVGWLVSGGDPGDVKEVQRIGQNIGIAFQIADDIDDMKKDGDKPNFANQFGIDEATEEINKRLLDAKRTLVKFGLWSPLWRNEIFPAIIR